MNCRDARLSDAGAIAEIYNYYIKYEIATFEELEVSESEMQHRIERVFAGHLPWLVAEQNGQIIGYAYATDWKPRSAYRNTKEVTVYVSNDHMGNGVGSALYDSLLQRLRKLDIHVVIGGITLPNPASVALHEKFGMRKVAHFEQVGYKFEQWLDVGYWQKSLGKLKQASGS